MDGTQRFAQLEKQKQELSTMHDQPLAGDPVDRIRKYFLGSGAELIDESTEEFVPHFKFSAENRTFSVFVVPDLTSRNRAAIISAALAAAKSQTHGSYVAIPKIYAAIIDNSVFIDNGLGLVIYDPRKIEETAKPNYKLRNEITSGDGDLSEQLLELRKQILALEKQIQELRDSIFSRETTSAPVSLLPASILAEKHTTRLSPDDKLPSFFGNNPWLDVLTRRGYNSAG